MNKIHISDIIKVDGDKIYYRDIRGDVVFIELTPCANSYDNINNINSSNRKPRCVGVRHFGEYAYYELYTAGHTQIYMNLKTNFFKRFVSGVFAWNFHAKEFETFYSFQKSLNENGWTTLDLS